MKVQSLKMCWRLKMQENKDYLLIDPEEGYEENKDLAKVKLITGEFSGVEYSYGVVSLDPDVNDADELHVSFEYNIHTEEKDFILNDEKNKKTFENVISSVLNSILMATVDKAEVRYTNELRKENTETPAV